ncbi:MAG: hypothetical protein AAGJ40_20310 [Planctomycetota bacterium]
MVSRDMRLLCTFLIHTALIVAALGSPTESEVDFGTTTRGGLGGQIIRVTNLNSTGRGSLRQALWAKGPRTVVFEVGGIIDLAGTSLSIANPFVTIAGQTAPSPGITLIRGGLNIKTHDVVVQHLRVRPGDAGHAKGGGWEVDAISLYSAHDVAIDHCSCSWATDENLSVSGPRFKGATAEEWRENTSRNISITHCIIAEALANSTHSEGEHSKGVLLHDNTRSILVFGNLFASNQDRNPFAKAGTHGAIVNNWISNAGSKGISIAGAEGEQWKGRQPQTSQSFIIGNLFEHGLDTSRGSPVIRVYGHPVELILQDNRGVRLDGRNAKPIDGQEPRVLDQSPRLSERWAVLPVSQVKESIRKNAGARPQDRDAVDSRIMQSAVSRTGRIVDSQNEVGGYPVQEPTHSPFRAEQWDLQTMNRR